MLDNIVGDSMVAKFFIAFVVVFVLIAVTAWLIRRFGSGALGGTGARGRAPRLAVIEAGAVDGRRKLVLIRRDNIEHLIMIGGPTDIVVEANIVRGQNAREAASSRASSVTEALRTLPAEETAWPLQPEAAPRPAARASKPAPLEETAHWALPPEPAPTVPPAPPPAPAKRSRSADTLAGLAAELSVRPAEPAVPPPPPAPVPRSAPAVEAPRAKAAAAPAPTPAATAAADQNLADMASRLEAALRRPGQAPAAPAPAARPASAPKPAAETPRTAPAVAPPIAPPAPPAAQDPGQPPAAATAPIVTIEPETKPADAKAGKTDDVFGSIEQEMANLLGRPSGKPS